MTINRKLMIAAGHGFFWAALLWILANTVWLPLIKTTSTNVPSFLEFNRVIGPVALGLGGMIAAQKVTFFAWERSLFWLWPAVAMGAFAINFREVLFPGRFATAHTHWGLGMGFAVFIWPYVVGMGSTLLLLNVLLKRAHSRKHAN